MTTPKRVSATQKKKRLLQLRDAQRRRRERLKDDSQHFVQIILPEVVLLKLREMVRETGETLQHIIGRLVEDSIEKMPLAHSAIQATQRIQAPEDDEMTASSPSADLDGQEASIIDEKGDARGDEKGDAHAENPDGVKPVNQLDLFG